MTEKIEMLEGELWKPIFLEGRKGTKQYVVSNMGRVASHSPDFSSVKLLSLDARKGKSPRIKIAFEEGLKGFYVHHLVATHFMPKPENATQLIHLDGNALNNNVTNLKWVTDNEAMSFRKKKPKEMKLYWNEEYKITDIKTAKKQYAITNYGRIISFTDVVEDGYILNAAYHNQGYKIWRFKSEGKHHHHLLHRLVATYFLNKPSELHDYVIHLDRNKSNNHISNLQWATQEQQIQFGLQSQASIENREKNLINRSQKTGKGNKLTEGKVRMIKRIVLNPERKTRYKMLAKQFGISEMQLHRIKTGENWGWVEV